MTMPSSIGTVGEVSSKLRFYMLREIYGQTWPRQLFAYQVAILNGLDLDRPRNLAKSVQEG